MRNALRVSMVMSAVLLLAASQGDWQQTWKLYRSDVAGSVQFGIERVRPGNHSSWSRDVPFSRFQGLTAEMLARGPAKFEYVHDAGRLICEGHFSAGSGAGTFTFSPNPQYAAELRRLGYEAPSDDKLFDMVAMDISLEFARGIRAEFHTATLDDLIKLRIHGVGIDFMKDARDLGYHFTPKELVELRIYGVNGDYLRKLQQSGLRNLTAEQIAKLRMHGVD